MHALIIEDENGVATAIQSVLRECGFTSFDVALSTQAAIDAAARRTPDLITTDVDLTPGRGIAAVEIICEVPAIPVVFITENADDVARRQPNLHVVHKPISEPALIAAVAAAMLEISGEALENRQTTASAIGRKRQVS